MRSPKKINKEFMALSLGFVMALAVRLWLTFKIKDIFGQGSDGMYPLLARNILHGKFHFDYGGWGDGFLFQPGYSAIAAFLNIFIHNLITSSQLVSIVSGGLVIFPLFYLAKRLFGLTTAYISLGLIIFYPGLVMISSQIITESLFTLLFISAIYLGYRAINERRKILSFWSGIIIGYSFIVKESGLIIALLLGGWIGLASLRDRSKRRSLWPPLIFILALLLIISPWLFYLRVHTGEWVLVPKTGFNLCIWYKFKGAVLNESATAFITTEESKDISLFKLMAKEPGRVLKKASLNLWKLYREIIPKEIPLFMLGLFFLGLFSLLKDKEANKKFIYMLSFFLPFFTLYPLVAVEGRYFLPLIPLAIIWMARGLAMLPIRRHIYPALFIILYLSFGAELKLDISKMKRIDNGWSKANREAGDWLKEHKNKDRPLILSRTSYPVFFAEGEYVFLPQENLERILKFAHYLKADYLILDKSFSIIYPQLTSLFISPPSLLKLIYRYTSKSQEILIFSLEH